MHINIEKRKKLDLYTYEVLSRPGIEFPSSFFSDFIPAQVNIYIWCLSFCKQRTQI